MIDRVLMYASALGNNLPHFAAHVTNKTGSTWSRCVCRIVRKDATKLAVVTCRPLEVVTLTLTSIMFAQCHSLSRQWFYFCAGAITRFCSCQLIHQLVKVLELTKCGPTFVTATPLRPRHQPDSERFREVLRGVCLRIPGWQMQDILSAFRFGLVEIRVRARKRAKQLAVLSLEV